MRKKDPILSENAAYSIHQMAIWTYLILMLVIPGLETKAQPWMQPPYLSIYQPSDSSKLANFYEIQKAFARYEKDQEGSTNDTDTNAINNNGEEEGKFAGYSIFKRWENEMAPRVFPSGDIRLPSTKYERFNEYLQSNAYTNVQYSPQQLTDTWSALGPTGNVTRSGSYGGAARVNFIRFDPTNSNTMWTCSPLGGLWKSTNAGLSWNTNTDQLPMIGCSDVAINPLNTQIMYLATGDANGVTSQLSISSIGIFKSIDGGLTWPGASNTLNWPVSLGNNIYKLLINHNHPDTVFAASNNGIFRTLNGGANWVLVQIGIFTDIEFKPGNPNIIYAASGLFSAGIFYRSTDGGNSFTSIASGLPNSASIGRLEIGVTPADSNYVYIVAIKKTTNDFYGFYASVDGGTNFTLRASTPNILAGIAGSQAWYDLAMNVSPYHKDTILVAGINIYRSVNGGVNWTQISSENGGAIPYVHTDNHCLEFLPGTDSVYFSGNDGGIFKSTDRGVSWAPLNEGLQIAQMYKLGTSHLNPYTLLTGHQDLATETLQNGNWSIFTLSTGDGFENIYQHNNDSIRYVESYNGRVLVAYNNAPSFHNVCLNNGSGVNAAGNWITPFVMNPRYDSTLLVGKAQVWRTNNGGTSFTQVGDVSSVAGNLVSLAYSSSDTNYIYAAKSNRLFVSTDGNTFVDRTGTLPIGTVSITSVVVSNTDPKKVWVTFSGYSAANKVWVSADAGLTWASYSTGLPNLPVNCIVYQNASYDGLYVGTDAGIYFRDNASASWQPYFTGLPNVAIEELEIAYGIGKIRAATNGRGLWESDLAVTVPTSFTWVGSISTNWNNPGNWSPRGVPTSLQDVTIPQVNNPNHYPTINVTGLGCRNISLNANAQLTIPPGNNFRVGG